MKMRILSKKTLAIFLSLTMLLSCMVWSGVSAITNADLTGNQLIYADYEGKPVDTVGGSTAAYKTTERSSNNTVVTGAKALLTTSEGAGYEDSNGYMELTYDADSSNERYWAAFRVFGEAMRTATASGVAAMGSNPKGIEGYSYRVSFEYKVVQIDSPEAILGVAYGGKNWGDENSSLSMMVKSGTSAIADHYTLTAADVSDEWQHFESVLTANSVNAWHIGLTSSRDGATNKVLIDNVVVEYVAGTVGTFSYDIDSTAYDWQGEIGTPIFLPTVAKEGYRLDGWYYDAAYTDPVGDTDTYSTDATTIYAKLTEAVEMSNIAFDANGGDAVASIRGEVGTPAILPIITRSGYRFDGWTNADGQLVKDINYPETADDTVTLTATWSKSVTNTFHYNDGTDTYVYVSTYERDSMNLATAPTREGYVFLGWYDADGVLYTADSTCPSTAITLTAKWRLTAEGETHDTDGYKTFFSTYHQKNDVPEGYAKGDTGALLNGNGSGRILSYLHNYDAATGTDVPGTAADGGYSVAISLSGKKNAEASPKFQLLQNEAKTMVTRGNDYVVSFMAYTTTAKDIQMRLGTTYTNNGNFTGSAAGQGQTAQAFAGSLTTFSLPANEWTLVTLNAIDLVGYTHDDIGTTKDLTLFLNVYDISGDYLYIDNVVVKEYAHADHTPTGMDFEELNNSAKLNLANDNTAYVSVNQNHTEGGRRSVLIESTWAGAKRSQFVVTDSEGNPVRIEAGESYRVSFWVMRAGYDTASNARQINWWLLASDETTTWTEGTDKTARLLQYGDDAAGTEWSYVELADGFEWKRVSVLLTDVQLQDASEDNILRIGIGSSGNTAYTLYVDDIVVKKLAPEEDTMTMEYETEGTDLNIRGAKHSAVVSSEKAHTGDQSLAISSTKDTSRSGNSRTQILLTNDLGANMTVELGKAYVFSFWVYVDTYNEVSSGGIDYSDSPSLDFWLAAIGDSTEAITATQDVADDPESEEDETKEYDYDKNDALLTGMEKEQYAVTKGEWQKISILLPEAAHNNNEGGNLLFGINATPRDANGKYTADWKIYVDDICFTSLDGATILDDVVNGYQYVTGGEQDNDSIEGETTTGSAIYVQDGVDKTAFRVAATYTADIDGVTMNKIRLDGHHYEIKERGILLGYADTLGDTALTVDTTAEQGLAGKRSITEGMDSYWKYDKDTNQVTYTILVRGVTKELKDTKFVARSFMRIVVNEVEYLVYSDESVEFTSQGIYNGTGGTAIWFS